MFLKKAGIEVRYGATHAKGFCIDNKLVLFGSTNLTQQSLLKNNETNMLFDDPKVAKGFEEYFTHLWQGGTHGGIQLTPPMVADGGFKDVIIKMIDSAKSRIDFSIYFFHQKDIEQAFIRAAERGVKIRGLLHTHKSFALGFVRATKSTAVRMGKSGITDLHFGPNHLFTHSKFIIRDRKEIALGTGNWLDQDVKIHPQLYIHFDNPVLARQLAQELQKQIKEQKTDKLVIN